MRHVRAFLRYDYSSALLNHFQRVVGHPLFFFAGFVGSIVWMVIEAFSPYPLDPPKAFYPGLMLTITVIGYLIESAMKVTQSKQTVQAQEQMNRLESLAKDSNRRDIVIQSLLDALDATVDTLLEEHDRKEDANEPIGLRSGDDTPTVNNDQTIADKN